MKIEELYIEGFGRFSATLIGPFTQRVTVICGSNEAGKSTLLAFIRTILFGFPPRRGDQHYPPLAGGSHGGRITIIDDNGNRYIIERFQGPKGGHLSIKTGDGAPTEEGTLDRLVVGQSFKDIFGNVFAFSLDELQKDDLLNDERVNGQIYSVGLGATKLPSVLKAVKEKRDAIFRAGGRNHEIARLLGELQGIDRKLTEVQGHAAEYGRLITRQAGIDQELEATNTERTQFMARQEEIGRLQQGWEDWVSLVGIEETLEKLPQLNGFPENSIGRLENAEDRIRSMKQDHKEVVDQVERAEAAARAQIADASLLEDIDSIERIRRGRGSFDGSVHDLPERKAELQSMGESLTERLRDLGPDWDEQRLESFDMSIAIRDQIARWQQSLSLKAHAVQEYASQLEQAKRAHRDSEETESEARQKVEQTQEPPFDAATLAQRQSALRTARTRLNEYRQGQLRHSDLRYQLESLEVQSDRGQESNRLQSRGLPLLLGLVGVILVAAGIFLGQQALPIGLIAGIALLGVAAYLLSKSGQTPLRISTLGTTALRDLIRNANDQEAAAEAALQEAATPFDLSLPDAVALDAVEAKLDAADKAALMRNTLNDRLAEATRVVGQQERRVVDVTQSLDLARKGQKDSQREWQAWLRNRGVAATFTPDTMVEFRGQVETARIQLNRVHEMRHRIAAIEYDIQEYRRLVEPLALKYGIPLRTTNAGQIAIAADKLIERYDTARKEVERRDIAQEDAENARQQLQHRERRLKEAEEMLGDLLAAGGTLDPEEFRRRAAQHTERQGLERKRHEHIMHLQRLSGPGNQFDRFREALAQTNLQMITSEARKLSELIEDVRSRQQALSEEKGRVETLLGQLTSEEDSSALRVQRTMLIQQLTENAREWSRLTLAGELLDRARQKFEKERQPGVIRHAQKFFTTITDQRYDRLYAPIGEQTITVMDQVGRSKQPSDLSRGTREQLYLALRFGLIREFGEHTERLPVVVDEVLVNFDPERAHRTADAFVDLSQTNQILVFTCHPEIAELFTTIDPNTEVIEINPSRLQ